MANIYKILALVLCLVIVAIVTIFSIILAVVLDSEDMDKTNSTETQEVGFTEQQLVEAVLIGDLDRVKEILTDLNFDENAKDNDVE